jgi:hypothetical protein
MVSEHVTHTVAGEEGKKVCRLDMEARNRVSRPCFLWISCVARA